MHHRSKFAIFGLLRRSSLDTLLRWVGRPFCIMTSNYNSLVTYSSQLKWQLQLYLSLVMIYIYLKIWFSIILFNWEKVFLIISGLPCENLTISNSNVTNLVGEYNTTFIVMCSSGYAIDNVTELFTTQCQSNRTWSDVHYCYSKHNLKRFTLKHRTLWLQ